MGAMHLLTGLGRAHRGNRIAAQIGNNTLLFGGAGASSPFCSSRQAAISQKRLLE